MHYAKYLLDITVSAGSYNTSSYGIISRYHIAYFGNSLEITCYSKKKPSWTKSKSIIPWLNYGILKRFDGIKETIVLHKVEFIDRGVYTCAGVGNKSFKSSTRVYIGSK